LSATSSSASALCALILELEHMTYSGAHDVLFKICQAISIFFVGKTLPPPFFALFHCPRPGSALDSSNFSASCAPDPGAQEVLTKKNACRSYSILFLIKTAFLALFVFVRDQDLRSTTTNFSASCAPDPATHHITKYMRLPTPPYPPPPLPLSLPPLALSA